MTQRRAKGVVGMLLLFHHPHKKKIRLKLIYGLVHTITWALIEIKV